MYALKARDKLHKREKEAAEERDREALQRAREQDAYHRGRTPDTAAAPNRPSASRRDAKYIGTFSVQFGVAAWQKDLAKCVKHHVGKLNMKNLTSCTPVSLLVSVEGVKVIATDNHRLIMAHALQRVLYVTADTKKCVFAMVARNPQTGAEGIYCHVFQLPSKEKAKDISELVGKAFKAAFTKQTLKRNRKKELPFPQEASAGISSHPWTVVKHEPEAGGIQPLRTDTERAGPSKNVHRGTSPVHQYRPVSEAEQLEAELLVLHSKIHELESRLARIGEQEDFAVELTVQLSAYQQQLEEKSKRLARLQSTQAPPPTSHSRRSGGDRNSLSDIDSLSLEDAEWFQAGLPREIAMEILSHQAEGAFIVRESASNPGCFALSLRTPSGKIVHYLIQQDSSGVHFQGSSQSFPSLLSLILHHSQHQDFLPSLLSLGETNPSFLHADTVQDGGSHDDVEEDLDFQTSLQYSLIDM